MPSLETRQNYYFEKNSKTYIKKVLGHCLQINRRNMPSEFCYIIIVIETIFFIYLANMTLASPKLKLKIYIYVRVCVKKYICFIEK